MSGGRLGRMRDPVRFAIYFVQIALLVLVGWIFRGAINPDGIAYIRTAGYFLEGPEQVAITGYWGPALSVVLAMFKSVGAPDLLDGRIVMGLGAVFFLLASDWFFVRAELPRRERLWALGALALATPLWSLENISPDVMVAPPSLTLQKVKSTITIAPKGAATAFK